VPRAPDCQLLISNLSFSTPVSGGQPFNGREDLLYGLKVVERATQAGIPCVVLRTSWEIERADPQSVGSGGWICSELKSLGLASGSFSVPDGVHVVGGVDSRSKILKILEEDVLDMKKIEREDFVRLSALVGIDVTDMKNWKLGGGHKILPCKLIVLSGPRDWVVTVKGIHTTSSGPGRIGYLRIEGAKEAIPGTRGMRQFFGMNVSLDKEDFGKVIDCGFSIPGLTRTLSGFRRFLGVLERQAERVKGDEQAKK
jgi:hypothetical protein